jgi:5-methylcytosine-specific restriction endonuclease McrA
MRNLTKPNMTQTEILEACVSNMEDLDEVKLIREQTQKFEEAYILYNHLSENNDLHQIEEGHSIQNLTDKQQKNLYSNKFSKADQPGREYYKILMDLALDKMCTYCGYRPANTLDHILAKTKFPAFSINPLNLVPTCSDCNKKKSSRKSAEKATNYLHPYYDYIDDCYWLKAELKHELPFHIDFYVDSPDSWDEINIQRTKIHFDRFSLNALYKIYSGTEISAKIYNFKEVFDSVGSSALKKELEREVTNFERLNKNTWQYAFYLELSTNDWFLSEMFKNSILDILG